MVAGSEVEAHVEEGSQRLEEVRCELGAAIGGDVERDAMLGEDMSDKSISYINGSCSICGRDENTLLG